MKKFVKIIILTLSLWIIFGFGINTLNAPTKSCTGNAIALYFFNVRIAGENWWTIKESEDSLLCDGPSIHRYGIPFAYKINGYLPPQYYQEKLFPNPFLNSFLNLVFYFVISYILLKFLKKTHQ